MTVGSIEIPMGGYYTFSDKYGNTTFELNVGGTPICLKIPEGKCAWTLLFVGPKREEKLHSKYSKNL